MNILFLDIDGVLCTRRSHLSQFKLSGMMEAWDLTGVQFIKNFCKEYKYTLVISSSWRHDEERTLDFLKHHGLQKFLHADWRTGQERTKRGIEVKEWLEAHPNTFKYFILDDNDDFLDEQKQFLIQTECNNGISADDMMTMRGI